MLLAHIHFTSLDGGTVSARERERNFDWKPLFFFSAPLEVDMRTLAFENHHVLDAEMCLHRLQSFRSINDCDEMRVNDEKRVRIGERENALAWETFPS